MTIALHNGNGKRRYSQHLGMKFSRLVHAKSPREILMSLANGDTEVHLVAIIQMNTTIILRLQNWVKIKESLTLKNSYIYLQMIIISL